jgi:hypothetical protein
VLLLVVVTVLGGEPCTMELVECCICQLSLIERMMILVLLVVVTVTVVG